MVERHISILAVALSASCDIFHSTDFPTQCSDGGCMEASNDAGVVPFTTDSTKALDYAKQTCAWLAACEGPLGGNETGKCIANAILAFDKTTNPNRQPKAAARTEWQCLFDAAAMKSCAVVQACAGGPVGCGGMFLGCAGTARIDCRASGQPPTRENCAGYGQACTAQNGNVNAECLGAGGFDASAGCFKTNAIVTNDAGADIGRDCASMGGGTCVDLFDAGVCTPEATGTCTPSLTVTCDGGVAHGCQSGIPEDVNCKTLSGGCAEGVYGPADPPSNACVSLTPTCSDDVCMGTALVACVRGRPMTIDCAGLGLKPCTTIPTTPDGPRPACGKPQ